jgi:hypothetical protein
VRRQGASLCVEPGGEDTVRLQLVSLDFDDAACSLHVDPSVAARPP